ncbi:cytochrome c peroxidase [Leeuwenhoekiella aestuarii]|uniref:Cytochrome c peroxidase n=1 Tax=Leeuwenhoekiella aestuarii TaxID=2249426 RepID=A0A4Q0NWU2_9FLAO|nr:cytochrome c peroxidase [Leeuwenhoekiella aestuarii]RXG15982.1 cytochrome c peroxidase [Leeuwenhoekiella aestuarii]RXG16676.1 cytochrome c peroxidase [Leeuwenhoekiella aestuarii]
MKRILITGILIASFVTSCKTETKDQDQLTALVDWQPAQEYYKNHLDTAIQYLDSLALTPIEDPKTKTYFKKARVAFKKAEPYASYINPEVGHRANGPALPFLTDDSQKVLEPVGLQKLEESIYEGVANAAIYQNELRLTKGLLEILKGNITQRELNAERFFIATHQQLMRMISLAIAGFDTPVSGLGLAETQQSLQSLQRVYELSIAERIVENDAQLDQEFKYQIQDAIAFIETNVDFETFDRYTFIRDYFNPITRSWVAIRKTSGLWEPVLNKPFNFDAPTFFEEDSFNIEYFRAITNRNPSEAKIALGKRLFFDKNLSQAKDMACVTCHNPKLAYTDGLVTNLNNSGNPLKRNSPTLVNAIFQRGFFWDGRAETLLAQISGVFTNKEEFNSSVHEFSDEVLKDSTYYKAFQEVFGTRRKWSNDETIKALSAYISTLNGFSSKFDKNIRGEVDTFTASEKLGMNLFMGKALCATCHFMPLTSGTVPPFFTDTEKEVIGVPETVANKQLDDDLGFYFMYNEPIQLGMFKTPTVRNVSLTAPYMHNGVYQSLEEVIDFYNKGGGGGLGFDLPHQTLPFDALNLTDTEQTALVDFLKTLTDVPQETEY